MFDKLEFLELFDEERILDRQVGTVEYKLKFEEKFILGLYMMPCEDYASVSLSYNNWGFFIFDIGLNEINKIDVDKKKPGYVFLNFYKKKSEEPVLRMQIKPTIAIQCSI